MRMNIFWKVIMLGGNVYRTGKEVDFHGHFGSVHSIGREYVPNSWVVEVDTVTFLYDCNTLQYLKNDWIRLHNPAYPQKVPNCRVFLNFLPKMTESKEKEEREKEHGNKFALNCKPLPCTISISNLLCISFLTSNTNICLPHQMQCEDALNSLLSNQPASIASPNSNQKKHINQLPYQLCAFIDW